MRRIARNSLLNAPEPAWIWDPESLRIVWANAAGLAFWRETSLTDLFERRFGPDEELSRGMRAAVTALEEKDLAELTLLLHPAGDAVEVACQVGETTLANRKFGLAVIARPTPSGADATPARCRKMLARAPVALALMDEAGAPLSLNRAAARLFGERETLALPARYAQPEAGRRALRAALIDGFFSHTHVLKTAGGGGRMRIALTRIHDPVTSAPAVLGAFWEAPEDEAEGAAHSELANLPTDVLSDALDRAGFGLALFDLETERLVYANAQAQDLLTPGGRGEAAAEPRGESRNDARNDARSDSRALSALFPRERDRLRHALAALRSGEETEAELDLQSRAGDRRGPWLNARLALSRTEGAALLVMSLADLGRERRTLLRVKLTEDERAAAIEALGVGLLFVDDQGAIVEAAPAAEALLAAQSGGLEGRTLPQLLAAPEAHRLGVYLREGPIVAGRRFETGADVTLTGLDGVARPARLAITAPNRRNRGRRCVAVAPRQVPPAPVRGEPADDILRAALLARASHDLRAPLTTIKGFAEMMRGDDEAALPERFREYLEDIAASVDDIAGRIDALFDPEDDKPLPPALERAMGVNAPLATATAVAPAQPRRPVVDLVALARERARRLVAERGGSAAAALRLEAETDASAPVDMEPLAEALDLLLRRALAGADPATRRPTLRIYADETGAARMELTDGALDLPGAEDAPAGHDPAALTTLRLAELLVEKAGARLQRGAASAGRERLEIVFPSVNS